MMAQCKLADYVTSQTDFLHSQCISWFFVLSSKNSFATGIFWNLKSSFKFSLSLNFGWGGGYSKGHELITIETQVF